MLHDIFFQSEGIPCIVQSVVAQALYRHYSLLQERIRMQSEGIVSWFNEQKGFGFITSSDGTDIMVHYSEILRAGFQTLEPGDRVIFEIVDEFHAPKAMQVRLKDEKKKPLFF